MLYNKYNKMNQDTCMKIAVYAVIFIVVILVVRYFLNNVDKNKDRIAEDINHNKHIMLTILEKDKKTVQWLQDELSVEISSIEKWLMAKDYKTYIRIPKL